MQRDLTDKPQLILDCRNHLGESILWDDRSERLLWVNIHEREIWSWDPFAEEAPRIQALPERPGAIGLRSGAGLVIGLEKGFALLDEEGGALTRSATVDVDRPSLRLNDGRVDPGGRFLCGGMDEAQPQAPIARLHALEPSGIVSTILSDFHCANALCWSPDGRRMYFTDMPSRRIDAYDYDPATGQTAGQRLFADLADEPGLADGSTVDAEGCVWNAQWGGRKLVRYDPDGKVEREVAMPVSNPTCLIFGGPARDILFVTSAWFGLSDAQHAAEPQAGGLYAFRPGPQGLAEHRFFG